MIQFQPLFQYLERQKENEKFIKSLEDLATILLVVFFLIFAIRPTVFTISALVGEIKSKEILQKQMRQKINNVIEAQDIFSQVQEKYAVVNSALPDSPSYTKIASQLQSLAVDAGFILDPVNFDLATRSEGVLTSFNIKISSNLPFASIIPFLDQLVRLRRLISLDAVSLSAATADNVGLNLSTKIYYWKN